MLILAIDPGYERLGIAVLQKEPRGKEDVLFSCCITTPRTLPHEKRLCIIGEEIARIIKKWKPEAAAIETLFFTTNQKTVMAVSEARGVMLYKAAEAGLRVFEYTPLQIKIAVTGYGRSDKRQVTEMVKRLVVLDARKRLDDEYDAIAVGLTCLASEHLGR